MKIALPYENGRLHGHFGGCREFAVVQTDSEKKTIIRTDVVAAPEHKPGLFPRWLHEQGVHIVIVGGIGRRAIDLFTQQGIHVLAGSAGELIEHVVTQYLKGELTDTPKGCTSHEHHHEHGHGHDHDHTHPSH